MLPAGYQEQLLPDVQTIGDAPDPGDGRRIEQSAEQPFRMEHGARQDHGNQHCDVRDEIVQKFLPPKPLRLSFGPLAPVRQFDKSNR